VIFRLAAIVFASIINSSGSSSVVFIWETIWFYGQASMGKSIFWASTFALRSYSVTNPQKRCASPAGH
jgi:hypothetical protein